MGESLKIGLIYESNANWTAGKNYIVNLIKAISASSNKNVTIYLFVKKHEDFDEINRLTNSQKLEKVLFPTAENYLVRFVNGLYKRIFQRKLIPNKCRLHLDVLYPSTLHPYFSKVENKLFWIPDIQEKTYPGFFSESELEYRNRNHLNLISKGYKLVFSSKSALNDFSEHYKCSNEKYVLNFTVSLDDYQKLEKEELLNKFNLPQDFFYSPNQFWQHKNHQTIIKAVHYLKNELGQKVTVAFSGNEHDYRDPNFIHELKRLVKEKNLESQIYFLGFIERNELLNLMHYSKAVIQPSLFEGWNTVVEECKMMNKKIFLSDIPVHREQVPSNDAFFKALDYKELANFLVSPIVANSTIFDEAESIKKYGNRFIEIVTQLNT